MAVVIKQTGLDDVINSILRKPRQPGEFTASEFYERAKANGHTQTIDSIRSSLARSAKSGELESRQSCEKGRIVTLYKLKK